MAWNLSEFFKDKKECLKELNNLNLIYDRLVVFKDSDFSDKKNLKKFLMFYDKYKKMIYEFNCYICLIEEMDYHDNDLIKIKSSFNGFVSKIEDVIKDIIIKYGSILDSIQINESDYKKLNYLFDCIESSNENESDKYSHIFLSLLNDVNSSKVDPHLFRHTFLELINNYYNSLCSSLCGSYNDYVFSYYDEISKKDYQKLASIIQNNSSINLDYFACVLNYNFKKLKMDYKTAQELAYYSLSLFGSEYTEFLSYILNSDSIDHDKGKYKSRGNYTYGFKNHRAFAKIDYDNELPSALSLVHELGHMVHHNCKLKYHDKTIGCYGVSSELFSLTNELMLGHNLLKHANSLEDKITISSELINLYYVNLFEAMCSVDLSLSIGNYIDKNSAIDLKAMNSLVKRLENNYNVLSYSDRWINDNNFDMINDIYYVYGLIGANYVWKSVSDNSFSSIDYIEALKGGNGLDVYRKLGCNPLDSDVANSCFAEYKRLVNNTKDLIYEKELKKKR